MKSLNQYIKEKLIINKDYHDNMIVIKSFDELLKIIEDRYDKLGPGTKKNPINFNDIDVSNIDSFCNDKGLFSRTRFKYIDISDWNVSNVKSMAAMFFECKALKSVGNISGWDVSNVTNMYGMFAWCEYFNQDISKWDVSNVIDMRYMFFGCENFNQNISGWDVSNVDNMASMFYSCKNFNQDISGWNVSNVTDMKYMFFDCEKFNQDISRWNVSKVYDKAGMFHYCSIKSEYKPKFK